MSRATITTTPTSDRPIPPRRRIAERLTQQEPRQEDGQERAERDQNGCVGGGRVVDTQDHEGVEGRVPEKRQEEHEAPVVAPERWAERARWLTANVASTSAATAQRNAAKASGGKKRLGRLDRGIAPAPDQDDEQENRDDARVGRASSGGGAGRDAQRFFMSSGKLEEKEYDFTTF